MSVMRQRPGSRFSRGEFLLQTNVFPMRNRSSADALTRGCAGSHVTVSSSGTLIKSWPAGSSGA